MRPEDSYDAWHVHDAGNVPYDPDEGLSEDQLNTVNALVDGRPVVAICGTGLTSTPFAFELDEHGYEDLSVVTGGMAEWSKLYRRSRPSASGLDTEAVHHLDAGMARVVRYVE